MLNFKQGNTTIRIITIDNEIVIKATRFTHNRLCMLITKCDGTVRDLDTKVNRLISLDDDMFVEFNRLQHQGADDENDD